MKKEEFVKVFNDKLKNYEPYGYNEDNDEILYAHSDILQVLLDIFEEIENSNTYKSSSEGII